MHPVARAGPERGSEPRFHREFKDERGVTWLAGMRARPGLDFKGRFYFVAMRKEDAASRAGPEVWLRDVCWNSEDTACRTLETMSGVELRRRLREARGRAHARP